MTTFSSVPRESPAPTDLTRSCIPASLVVGEKIRRGSEDRLNLAKPARPCHGENTESRGWEERQGSELSWLHRLSVCLAFSVDWEVLGTLEGQEGGLWLGPGSQMRT